MQQKIVFLLTQDDDGYPPVVAEGIWAMDKGNNQYEIDNIPFFTREATLGDVVEATSHSSELRYQRTLKQSDNSLLRVVYYDGTDPTSLRDHLKQIGCSTEWDSDHHLIAVNVPSKTRLSDVIAFLQNGLDQGHWDYEEAIIRQ